MKIIHKASYLRCYQKRSYIESVGRPFGTQYLCSKFFNARDYTSGKLQDWARQNKASILDNILIGNQLGNQKTGYQKTATLQAGFIKESGFL